MGQPRTRQREYPETSGGRKTSRAHEYPVPRADAIWGEFSMPLSVHPAPPQGETVQYAEQGAVWDAEARQTLADNVRALISRPDDGSPRRLADRSKPRGTDLCEHHMHLPVARNPLARTGGGLPSAPPQYETIQYARQGAVWDAEARQTLTDNVRALTLRLDDGPSSRRLADDCSRSQPRGMARCDRHMHLATVSDRTAPATRTGAPARAPRFDWPSPARGMLAARVAGVVPGAPRGAGSRRAVGAHQVSGTGEVSATHVAPSEATCVVSDIALPHEPQRLLGSFASAPQVAPSSVQGQLGQTAMPAPPDAQHAPAPSADRSNGGFGGAGGALLQRHVTNGRLP